LIDRPIWIQELFEEFYHWQL